MILQFSAGLEVCLQGRDGCAEVSFSDGNEIKNRTKGTGDKESNEGERISLSPSFNDFKEALYLQCIDLWLL